MKGVLTRSSARDPVDSTLSCGVTVGGISPKNVEAIPARVGLELNGAPTLDPALRENGGVQHVCGIEKVDLATACQSPFFAV